MHPAKPEYMDLFAVWLQGASGQWVNRFVGQADQDYFMAGGQPFYLMEQSEFVPLVEWKRKS